MTSVERYSARNSIEIAGDAWAIAQRIAKTDFVPDALRGKPEAVLACILAGHELEISPMQSLQEIHVIKGRPSLSAKMQRAIIIRAGHEIWIEDSTITRAVVKGRRRDSAREGSVTWTEEDAKRAMLLGKDNWKHYPAAMLIARASSQLARNLFSDVLAGFGYSVEELEDGFGDELAELGAPAPPPPPGPSSTRVRAPQAATRGATATNETEPEPEPRAPREEAPLPGDGDDESLISGNVIDTNAREAETVFDRDPIGDGDGSELEPDLEQEGRPRTGPQQIAIVFAKREISDRAVRLRICSKIIGREISSGNELTVDEIGLVLRTLDETPADRKLPGEDAAPEPEPPRPEPSSAEADSPAGREGTAESSTSGPERVSQPTGPDVGEPRARGRAAAPEAPADPEDWTADHWRAFIRSRGVKASELLKEATRLATEISLTPPETLDALEGFGIAQDLVRYCEDAATERQAPGS